MTMFLIMKATIILKMLLVLINLYIKYTVKFINILQTSYFIYLLKHSSKITSDMNWCFRMANVMKSFVKLPIGRWLEKYCLK